MAKHCHLARTLFDLLEFAIRYSLHSLNVDATKARSPTTLCHRVDRHLGLRLVGLSIEYQV